MQNRIPYNTHFNLSISANQKSQKHNLHFDHRITKYDEEKTRKSDLHFLILVGVSDTNYNG